MDDLNARLDKLLEDPQITDKINAVLSSLSQEDDDKKPPEPQKNDGGVDLSSILGSVDMGEVMKLLGGTGSGGLSGLLGGGKSGGGDLLNALRPYLRPSRRKKVDEAQMLMTVWRLLPAITQGQEDENKDK